MAVIDLGAPQEINDEGIIRTQSMSTLFTYLQLIIIAGVTDTFCYTVDVLQLQVHRPPTRWGWGCKRVMGQHNGHQRVFLSGAGHHLRSLSI